MKKRKDGRYAKKITLPDGTKKFIYGKSAPEVTQKERDLLKEFEAGLILGDTTTVGQWAETWFETYKSKLRYKTREAYTNAYNKHIMPYIGGLLLRDVRPVHVQNLMNHISDKSESLQTKVLTTAKQIFSTAAENRLVDRNPAAGIRINKNTKDDRIKYLQEIQWKTLLEGVEDDTARLFCAICIYSGLRREEALGLQWGDIYDDMIHVRRAVTFTDNAPDTDQSLKSKAANREIPVMQELKKILDTTAKRNLYLFTDRLGNPMSKTAFRRMWDKVVKSIDYHVHPHMLRHTYATILYSAGIDLKTAQYLLGHSDIRMTANIYTHIEKCQVVAASKKIQDFLSGSQKGSQVNKSTNKMA